LAICNFGLAQLAWSLLLLLLLFLLLMLPLLLLTTQNLLFLWLPPRL